MPNPRGLLRLMMTPASFLDRLDSSKDASLILFFSPVCRPGACAVDEARVHRGHAGKMAANGFRAGFRWFTGGHSQRVSLTEHLETHRHTPVFPTREMCCISN